jgi:hypothetical protein
VLALGAFDVRYIARRLRYRRHMESSTRGPFDLVAEPIENGQRYRLLHQGDAVSYERAVRGLCEERELRELLA